MADRIIVVVAIGVLMVSGVVLAERPAATPQSTQSATPVTFHNDVLPILQKNCQSCHRPGQIAPFSMLNYQETRPWAKAIKGAVVSRTMPPWPADRNYGHFLNDRSLKQADIDTLAAWADTGASEGDPSTAPAPVQWPADNWKIQPDRIVDLPAYPVPARGTLEWYNLAVPVPFQEDTWVTSMELLPGDPAVVHHICWSFEKHRPTTVYNRYEWMELPRDEAGVATIRGNTPMIREEQIIATQVVGSAEIKRSRGRLSIAGGIQFCYVPGLTYEDYRVWGAGRLVPAGSDIILSIHYTPNGKEVVDRSRIGFTVAKTPPAKKFVQLLAAGGAVPTGAGGVPAGAGGVPTGATRRMLAIPPFDDNYLAPPLDITFLKDVELVWLWPHAHLRGKSAMFKLIHPDGREEILLNVPRYDFNWQLSYQTSVKIPKGARIHAELRYDNSAKNKFNPDPSRWVYEGDQTWEEMTGLVTGYLLDRDADETNFTTRFVPLTGG